MARRATASAWTALAAAVTLAGAAAAEGPAVTFDAESLEAVRGTFLVVGSGVNVRRLPDTGGERLGTLAPGERVEVVGRARGAAWYAIRRGGTALGYAYAPAFARLIDGRVAAPLNGSAAGRDGAECGYGIRFEGETRVEDEPMITADYWVRLDCRRAGRAFEVPAFMFLTEVPYDLGSDEVYQVSVEVPHVGGEYEEALSAVFLYHWAEGRLVLDGVAPDELARPGDTTERAVDGVPQVLRAAVEMAVASWNEGAWEALARR